MKSAILFSVLPLLASAIPNGLFPRGTGGVIELLVNAFGDPLDGTPITACNGKFWVGGVSCTYCPTNLPEGSCPPANNGTVKIVYSPQNNGRAGMHAVVPGGQQVYVSASGALKYTQAHTGGPPASEGAVLDGFGYRPYKLWDGDRPGSFWWREDHGMYACPPGGATNGAEYQLFARSPANDRRKIYVGAWDNGLDATWQYE